MGIATRDSGFESARRLLFGRSSESSGDRIPDPQSPIPVLNAILDYDVAVRAGWTLVDLATAFLDGGARFLQVRGKSLSSGALFDVAASIVDRAAGSGALVVVNDRADVALMARASGVHVGQDDLPPAMVRRLLGPDRVVGFSTHTVEQIDAAIREPISYLAVGPVFGSATKATGYEAIGLERVRYAADRAAPQRVGVVAIGGITVANAADVVRAGADSVAVISDLLTGDAPAARVRAFLTRLNDAGAASGRSYPGHDV